MTSVMGFLTQWGQSRRPYILSRRGVLDYATVNALALRMSESLRAEGIVDENIALLMENSSEYVLAYFAIRLAQSTVIPVNPKLTQNEVVAELRYCDCNWLILTPNHLEFCHRVADQVGVGIVLLEEDCSSTVLQRPRRQAIRLNSSDIVVMLHTSGTTGDPKKVMLSEANLVASTSSHIASLGLSAQDVVLVALPMFFGYCHTSQFLTHTRLGGTLVLLDQALFTAKRFCELVQSHHVTCFTAVPTMLALLDRYPYLGRYDLSSLRYICFGGAKASPELLRSLMRKLPAVGFVNTYGQTECSPRVTALLPEDSRGKLGSIGKAIPGVVVEVVDEQLVPVPPGEIGEIRVAGANVTPGYYKKPNETATLLRDGYLYTGDLACQDDEGYLYLVGRKTAVIISGGINVYPEEVEEALLALPFLADAIVFGEEDPSLGELVAARVVPREGNKVTLKMIHEALADRLARYKWPQRLYPVRELGTTPTGKKRRV